MTERDTISTRSHDL